METTIFTPRLKLTLLTTAEPGSRELEMVHELRSNEQSGFWSLGGPAKELVQTEAALKNILPVATQDGGEKSHRIAYMVHQLTSPPSDSDSHTDDPPSRFIGLITLRTHTGADLSRPPRLNFASTPTMLTLELAYMFFPTSWGQGYATEAITTMFSACQRAREFWAPYKRLCVKVIVNDANKASQGVMRKCGMGKPEDIVVEGQPIFVAGEWNSRHDLFIYTREFEVDG